MSDSSASTPFPERCASRAHYPQLRFENGQRWLWNPARRQLLKMRPEERVRLQVMEWLHHECGIPMHRMSSELPVKLRLKPAEALKRADILAYSADFKPFLLIECKAEDVRLNEKAAVQIAAYNEDIRAPYLMLTNGREERCYEIEESRPVRRIHSERFIQKNQTTLTALRRELVYWQRRGFAGSSIPGFEALPQALTFLFTEGDHECRFLQVSASGAYPDFSHYYAIYNDWAITIAADEQGGSWLVALNDTPGHDNRMLCYELSQRSQLPPVWLEPGQEFSLQDEPHESLLEPLRQPDEHILARLVARLRDLSQFTNITG
jgi:hypothetical protein